MKKNNKGFTLIELLVVLAIIGILAAVGVVAYSGYTKGAKKSAVKSNHAAVLKYVAAELKKCEFGETNVMVKGTKKLVCANRKTATTVHTAVNDALAAITAEILQIQADGGQVPPELEALAQELEKIKAASIPSLEAAE